MCVTASFLLVGFLDLEFFFTAAAAEETFQLLSLGLPLQWQLTFIKKLDSEEDTHARLSRTDCGPQARCLRKCTNPGRFWKPSFNSGLTRECFAAPSHAIRPER